MLGWNIFTTTQQPIARIKPMKWRAKMKNPKYIERYMQNQTYVNADVGGKEENLIQENLERGKPREKKKKKIPRRQIKRKTTHKMTWKWKKAEIPDRKPPELGEMGSTREKNLHFISFPVGLRHDAESNAPNHEWIILLSD